MRTFFRALILARIKNKLYIYTVHSKERKMPASQFMADIRSQMRLRQYSLQTEKTYLYWIRYFIRFHGMKHPRDMGSEEVTAFLSYLANRQHVSPNTQKTALNALAFLYQKFLKQPLGDLGFSYSSKPAQIPVVLDFDEVTRILQVFLNPRDHFFCYSF